MFPSLCPQTEHAAPSCSGRTYKHWVLTWTGSGSRKPLNSPSLSVKRAIPTGRCGDFWDRYAPSITPSFLRAEWVQNLPRAGSASSRPNRRPTTDNPLMSTVFAFLTLVHCRDLPFHVSTTIKYGPFLLS